MEKERIGLFCFPQQRAAEIATATVIALIGSIPSYQYRGYDFVCNSGLGAGFLFFSSFIWVTNSAFGGTTVIARVSQYEVCQVGDEVEFIFVPHRMHFFDCDTEEAITL